MGNSSTVLHSAGVAQNEQCAAARCVSHCADWAKRSRVHSPYHGPMDSNARGTRALSIRVKRDSAQTVGQIGRQTAHTFPRAQPVQAASRSAVNGQRVFRDLEGIL